MRWFNRGGGQEGGPPERTSYTYDGSEADLDQTLLDFYGDPFTIRNACEGVQVFGGIGSGKTSGSGAALARAFLRAGFGGLVCCAKPEERALWERYAQQTGRSGDLVIVRPGQGKEPPPWRFNFLDYELRRAGAGGGQTENVINLLATVAELVDGKQGEGEDGGFWQKAGKNLLRNTVDLIFLAGKPLTLKTVCETIAEAPQNMEQVRGQDKGTDRSGKAITGYWRAESPTAQLFREAQARKNAGELTLAQQQSYEATARYFLQSYPVLNDRTRTSITITVDTMMDVLVRGLAWELLGTDMNISPEMTYRRKAIIVLDLSIQEYREAGRIVQGIWKRLFQEALLRRNVTQWPRPVFLWADEAQHFVSPFDWQFLSTARSARCAVVYLTQNISNYHARLGHNARADADALLAMFQTKVFHAQADTITNQYAADLVGKEWRTRGNRGAGGGQGGASVNVGSSDSLEYKLEPTFFTTLKKGGPQNRRQVDGVIFQGGRQFTHTGDTYLLATFEQE